MDLDKIKLQIKSCLNILYVNDEILFTRNSGKGLCERCLTFRFGIYLQGAFNKYFVDCDFNSSVENGNYRNGKRIMNSNGIAKRRFVDVIIHRRGDDGNESDFICFEIKKWNSKKSGTEKDLEILKAMTRDYGYKYGFHLVFGKNRLESKWTIFGRNDFCEPESNIFGKNDQSN